eukprot:765983-Hanusia_phi.AAC.4
MQVAAVAMLLLGGVEAFQHPLPLARPRALASSSLSPPLASHTFSIPGLRKRQGSVGLRMGLFDTVAKSFGMGKEEATSEGGVVFGVGTAENQKFVQELLTRVEKKINVLEDEIEKLSDDQLRAKTEEFKKRLQGGESEDDILDEAFAVVREAAWRVLKLRHYDVQLVGGMVLHQRKLAEMATGEGKTLVATLPSYLNALSGKGVHVVTVNDYLARRDAENMGQIHRFLGLTVGLIQAEMKPEERRLNYGCDITYVTNSELGFDYLRDNLAIKPEDIVLTRPFNFCIVDEADSIMVDEARTPLIISEKTAAPAAKYANSAKIATVLEEKVHYTVDEKSQSVTLTERGFADVEKILNVKDLFNPKDPWSPYIINALKAKTLFKKDIQYVVRANEVMIVDEFTGRVLEGRRWSNGLHQSVEAKEGLKPSSETQTVASITYQSFFRLFPKLSGMTGTARTEEKEFGDIYGLEVMSIPTALPVSRRDNPDVTFRTQAGKWKAVMGDIARRHTKGQPILIGTTSIAASEQLSKLMTELQVPHEVLNAKPEVVTRENEIVAQAGRAFAITIATNMAGRGTDILLGGNSGFFAKKRIMQKLAPALVDKKNGLPSKEAMEIKQNPACIPLPELSEDAVKKIDDAVEASAKALGSLPSMLEVESLLAIAAETGPVEAGSHLEQLREAYKLVKEEYDVRCKKEKLEVEELGGLHVIGTERHESRRIDQQLRGRAGRQGDPGSSRFFLALDDRLFQVFGGTSIDGLLDKLKVEEDMPLEAKSVSDALDGVQRRVEEYFYGIRKEMFKYDEILSSQRESIYSMRRKFVMEDSGYMSDTILEYCLDTAEEIIPNYIKEGKLDATGLANKLAQFFDGIQLKDAELAALKSRDEVREVVRRQVQDVLERKEGELDAVKDNFSFEIERYIVLTQVDLLWKQHLKDIDFLKDFIGLRAYKGDPFIEFQQEGYELYQDMLKAVRR